ncbi:MAG: hypothetical protein ACYTGH_00550 [Planctomycetota bacterium]|jgi:predicted RNase H-like nuclease (RuvC/YqgF family)
MAKNASFLSQAWWVALAILALSFGGLLATVGVLTAMGKVEKKTFLSMAEVLRGTHIALPKEDVQELIQLRKKDEERLIKATKEKGGAFIRGKSLEAEQDEIKRLREERAVLKERLQRELEDLKKLRAEVDSGMQEADKKRRQLNEARALAAKKDLAKDTQDFDRTLATIDPEIIARDMEKMILQGESNNASRLLKKIKPNKRAEVLGEMKEGARLVLLPLLENRYATIAPEKVVQSWLAQGMGPAEYRVFLESMPSIQAFRVWRNLDRSARNEVLELMAPVERGGR